MNEKGEQFYEFIKAQGISVPNSYVEFKTAMQDANTANQFHAFVSSKNITVPESVEEFQSVFSEGGADVNFTEGSQEPSQQPSQQPSQPSKKSGIKQDILNKYPALKNVYGQQGENLVIDADTNFKPFEIGYGGIEFYSPEQSEITYGEGYSYEHPSKGKYAVKYNPEKAGEQDIFLDLLHGMDADPEYKKLREEFKKQTLKDRGGDIEYFYNKDKKEGFAEDGKERWVDNYVDGLIRSELAVGSEDYAKEASGNSKEMKAIASRLNDYLISQPSEESGIQSNVPEYFVNGKAVPKEQLEKQLSNPKFIEKVKAGEFDVEIKNDEELGLLLSPNLATTSDGKYSVDVSGTILFPKTGGQPQPTTFQELVEISRGDTDAAIRMFANRSETNKVAKSPSKERVEEMVKEPIPTQEEMQKEVDEEFAVKYSAGNLYEDYIGKNTTLDSLYSEINFLENLDTPPQEKIQELKAQAQQAAEEVKNSAEKITQPVLEKNIDKYINEDGTIKEEYMTESFYGIPQVDRDKIREELSPDEFIVDENLRTKYLFDLSQELQDQHDVPQAKRTEEANKLFKEKYGKSFEEELDVRASEAFESKYGKALGQINNDYKTKINKANAEAELDVETYVSKLTTEYDNITNQFNGEINRISQQLETASEQDYKALIAEAERLTKQYNKKVDAYIQQETDYRADVNARLNSLNEQYFSEAQQQTDVLSKEFSEKFQVPTDLIDNYNSVYGTAVGKLFEESNREKKKIIQEETDIPLGRIATNTLSSLGGSLYAITKAYGGEFPELKRMEQYFQPSVDPIKGFKDLNLYNIQESAGQLVGSMTPSILASIGTAAATRDMSATARMFAVASAGLVAESSDLAGRAYQTALETTGSQAIAKNAANETIDSQLLLAPTYLISSLPFIGGLKRIANRPLRVATGGLVEYATEGGLQEFPQQIFEESIQKYGQFERAGEFATMEKFEEVMSNVIPAFVPGAIGSWNTDPAIKLKRAIDKNPELARQFIVDFTYKNGKEKTALMLAALRSNGKVDKSTAENLFTYVEGIDLNNSQEYTVIKGRRDDLIAARENESDDIKRKVIDKQISELETQLENILEGRETNVTQTTVAGVEFFTTPQQEQQTDVLQDLDGVQQSIDEAEGKPVEEVEEIPLVTDEAGEVITVYRGGKPTSGVQYYTSDRKLAESIGEGKGEPVETATVRMANPWTPESLDVNNAPQWMQDWVRSQEEFTTVDEETLAAEEVPMEQALQEIKDMQLSFRDVGLWQSFVNEALKHHDGIIAFDPSEDMAADKKIYITRLPEQVIRQEDAIQERETAQVPVGEEARVSEEVDKEVREQATPEEEVAAAKQNLQDAWSKWKEQQQNVGIAFDPRSRGEQDAALARAVLDYLKAIGAKTIEDVKAAVKDLAGFSIKDEDAKYLLDASRKENIAEKIKKGIDAQVPYADIESELLAEGYEKEDIAKRYNVEVGRKTKSRDQQLREYQENFEKARRASRDKGKILDRVVDVATKFIKGTVDPKIEAKSLFKKLGMQSVLDRLQNIYGISGAAKFRFEEAYKKIYQGLSTEDTTILDQLIQLRRFIAIDENRAKNNLPKVEHPDFITGEDAKVRISDIQNQIGQAKFLDLQKRADAYFDEFRKTLDKFEKAGLISKELRDELYEIDYQPRKFLEFLLDADQRNQTAEQTRSEIGINKEVIKRLETGDDTELFNNSEWLLSTAINQAEIATKYNEFFRKLAKEIDKLKPEERRNDVMFNNPIIRLDKKGNPKYKFDKPPKGFTVVRYKDNGVENQIFMEQTVYDSLMGVDMFRDPGKTNTIQKILQAPGNFLRAFATGINPAFVLGNLPNDFGFALTFEDAYSNFLPKAIKQLSTDMKNAWVSIANKDQTFKDFVQYGGMMDFLYTMGALDEKGLTDKVLDNAFSLFTDEKIGKERRQKISEGVTYLNKMSELGIRVGVYTRVFNQEMEKISKQTFESEQAKQEAIEDAKYHAVARARNLIDFTQGGSNVKYLDRYLPYLNAAFQATYSATKGFLKNPVRASLIMAQAAGAFGSFVGLLSFGLISALKGDDDEDKTVGEIYYETLDNISYYTKRKYFIIPTGQKDKDGNYEYIKIKKTQNLTPIFVISEYYTNKLGREIVGVEPEKEKILYEQLSDAIADDVDPTGLLNPNVWAQGVVPILAQFANRSPVASGFIVLTTGYDPYKNRSVDEFEKYPGRAGYDDPKIEQFYKDLSTTAGVSPARLKTATEKIITNPNTNPFVGSFYTLLDVSAGNKELQAIATEPAQGFVKGMRGRMVGKTSPYIKTYEKNKEADKKRAELNKERESYDIEENKILEDFYTGKINKKQVIERATKLAEENLDPEDKIPRLKKMQEKLNKPDVPYVYSSIAYTRTPEEQAILIVEHFGSDILQDSDKYYEMESNFKKIGFNISKELRLEILRLVDPEAADKFIKDKINPPKKRQKIFVSPPV